MSHFESPHWTDRMVAGRYWLLGFAFLLFVGAKFAARQPAVDRSIESMFAPDDPVLVPYRRMQRTFGEHEIVLAVYPDEALRDSEGLERVRKLSAALREVPGVVAVVSLLDPPAAANFDDSGVGRRFREVFASYTHNQDLSAAGVICLIHRLGQGDVPRGETIAQMRRVVAGEPWHGVLVGEPVLIEQTFDLLAADGNRLYVWCTILVLATVVVCLRGLRWIVLPLAVVQLALALTHAALSLAQVRQSMVSPMLEAIVTIVGVATVVRQIAYYLDQRRIGFDEKRALAKTINELALPVTTVVAATASGFASLMISRAGPVRDYGLMNAVGSFMILPSCALLAPAMLLWSDVGARPQGQEESAIERTLGRLFAWSQVHWRAVVVGTIGLTALAITGSSRLGLEAEFTKNFRTASPIAHAYDLVETRFGGAGVWELMLPAPQPKVSRQATGSATFTRPMPPPREYIKRVVDLEATLLAQLPGKLTKAMSLGDSLQAALGDLARLPAIAARTGVFVAWKQSAALMPEFFDGMYHADPVDGSEWMHVLLRSPDRLSAADKVELIDEVESISAERIPGAEVTGYYVLLTKLVQGIRADLWRSFGVAAVVVLALMLAAARDIRLALAALVPNLIPPLVLLGAMGWLGLKVNMGAAMIAGVSVGLSVAGSIYYVMCYQRHRRDGLSRDAALAASQGSAGRAAMFATLVLVVGFATLGTSDFVPTTYFGLLMALSMFGGLAANILALAGLVRAVDRPRRVLEPAPSPPGNPAAAGVPYHGL